ncbi:Imidazoleglycerol-phosphate dehydratase like protein, partial [Aduncisulcus paluster]
ARACEATLHIKTLEAGNAHHTLEGVFKGFARTIKEAIRIVDTSDTARIPSTKGSL